MNINEQFDYYNKKYFKNRLKKIPVMIRCLSKCDYHGIYYPSTSIVIGKHLKRHQKNNVLLHEMCHHAVETIDGVDYHHHGMKWKQRMRSCGFKGKINAYSAILKKN